jgi:hypothetical protein
MSKWILVGHLGNGVAVYYQKEGGLAVEKDQQHLVDPTPEERAEIYKTMSHLRPIEEAES